MKTALVRWRGNHVYRTCKCGETAFDAEYAGELDGIRLFRYLCRNCRTRHYFLVKHAQQAPQP